jgi:ribosomal-protein-alanine N-acetyltransferase
MGRPHFGHENTSERPMSAAIQLQWQIRAMSIADLKEVADIERVNYDFPWTLGIFRDCLLAGYQSIAIEITGMPCNQSSKVVRGYGIMSVAAGEAHILNLCVHPEFQSVGYGRQLLNALLKKAKSLGVERVFLEVRPSNNVAISLYQSIGFKKIGVRPSYYRATVSREDAVVFAASLSKIQQLLP